MHSLYPGNEVIKLYKNFPVPQKLVGLRIGALQGGYHMLLEGH